jgi:hypothetical protein
MVRLIGRRIAAQTGPFGLRERPQTSAARCKVFSALGMTLRPARS